MAPVRLLLVDDDETVLSTLGAILEAHEFEVTTASTVVEALKLITSQSFDVLLTDLHMPGAGDGLIVVGAMRRANPAAVTLVLSANPDMSKATAALLRDADEVFLKPAKAGPIVEAIRKRLADEDRTPHFPNVEPIASVLEREREAITRAWVAKMKESGAQGADRLSTEELAGHLPEMLGELIYRLRYPQPLGVMTLFSMASLQHGAQRRRQGAAAPLLVVEARALQVAVFQAIETNLEKIDLGQLPTTLMAIADEINAQLLQSLSGYEKEKPAQFTEGDEKGGVPLS